MSKVIYDPTRCKGCHYCVLACPAGAVQVTGQTNAKGYSIVAFQDARCTACGACYRVCPDYAIEVRRQRGGSDG